MKTNDIVKLGIDRNFIRECERQGLITPTRTEGKMIVEEKYCPRDYSQTDLEIIWGTYLLRKMGIPFPKIKEWWNGEIIDIRYCINDSIEKYERQIEELQTTINFMKYVSGLGVFPDPPKELNEVSNFKDFLIEYMKSIDSNGKKKEMLGYIHRELELSRIPREELTKVQRLELQKIKRNIEHYIDAELIENSNYVLINEIKPYAKLFSELVAIKEKHLDFSSESAREKIREMYNTFKKSMNMEQLKPFEFGYIMCCFCSEKNDLTERMIETLGKENIEYFCNAALEFARIEDSETYNNFLKKFS